MLRAMGIMPSADMFAVPEGREGAGPVPKSQALDMQVPSISDPDRVPTKTFSTNERRPQNC